ncbi:MAG: Uma2 family endonuclease, partial [Bacteroidota bacterium]
MFAMAGGTLNHSKLGSNIMAQLINRESTNGCSSFNGDAKIRVDSGNRFVYPDALVVCGEIESSQYDPNSITNPILVVEVLSDSTEKYDQGEKFRIYRNLPSFKEYVLIDQKRP